MRPTICGAKSPRSVALPCGISCAKVARRIELPDLKCEGSAGFKSSPKSFSNAIKAGLTRLNPACPASLGTLKVSVPPAVKLAAATHAQPALDPDIIGSQVHRHLDGLNSSS